MINVLCKIIYKIALNISEMPIPRAMFFSGFLISEPILMIVWNALNEKIIPDVVVAAKIGALPYGINVFKE